MYQHEITDFGDYKKHTLIHKASNNALSIVPAFGACLLDLQFNGESIIDGYQTGPEMKTNKWYKNNVLFPFPNRLNEGMYVWEEKGYEFAINDSYTGNALHGFGSEKEMEVVNVTLSDDYAVIRCRYKDEGGQAGYPFPFTFEVEYSIDNKQSFEVDLYFMNQHHKAIPVGLGWHPYFKLSDKVDDLKIQFPTCALVGVNEHMIPTGKKYPYVEFKELKKIGITVLDNCFALPKEEGRVELVLESKTRKLKYWQETGLSKYNFIQVFTPPHRTSIAIEPMTCNIDAFNNKEGLIILEPGEICSGRFGLSFSKLND